MAAHNTPEPVEERFNEEGTQTVLFLYTRLAPYLVACIRELALQVKEIHIVHYPAGPDAPFTFEFPTNVVVHQREALSSQQLWMLVRQTHPALILCSGWRDLGYLRTCRKARKHTHTLLLMDNRWRGLLRQRLWQHLGRVLLPRIFSKIWIPGPPQKAYAARLGFTNENIILDFYCADIKLFRHIYTNKTKTKDFPKTFLFAGRYVPQKGLELLLKAFIELKEEDPNSWQLWCIGEGPLKKSLPAHPDINHLGFLPQPELAELLTGAGVFVLPSRFEPWGMVVQEMATAGLPVIASDKVGAAALFVKPGENGYIFESDLKDQLKACMRKMIHMDASQLVEMSTNSHQLGISYTPSQWVGKVLGLMSKKGEPQKKEAKKGTAKVAEETQSARSKRIK